MTAVLFFGCLLNGNTLLLGQAALLVLLAAAARARVVAPDLFRPLLAACRCCTRRHRLSRWRSRSRCGGGPARACRRRCRMGDDHRLFVVLAIGVLIKLHAITAIM